MTKIFILSPAKTDGIRAKQLANPGSKSPVAHRLHHGESVPLGELFSFVSGLYFRGKITYVHRFAKKGNAFVITSNQGLVSVDTLVSLAEFLAFSKVKIDHKNEEYRRPLEIDLAAWSRRTGFDFILLGSIASPKYAKVLAPFLKEHLYVPKLFHGMGDMSRGSLMLRQALKGEELEYEKFPRSKNYGTARSAISV